MNLKTTLVLLILVAAGGALLWVGLTPPSAVSESSTAGKVLENDLTPDKLTRIEVKRGDGSSVVLERSLGGEWSLPGKWPARQAEVDGLVQQIGGLRFRFVPERLADIPDEQKPFGPGRPALIIMVHSGDREHRLEFGEEPDSGKGNRFSRPTFVRIDDSDEVIRLAPGLIAVLDRPMDYYQQRRLFRSERVAGSESGSAEKKEEQLAAEAIAVQDKDPANSYSLTRAGKDWEMRGPVQDRVDPDKLKTLLGSVPDIWAEQFVTGPAKPLADYGLDKLEQSLTVTRGKDDTATLLIGKLSPTVHERQVTRPAPQMPGQPPMPPQTETVREEYRYAKLKDNDQVFEIKADRLKDVFVPSKDLRDPKLARFNTSDARRLEIKYAGQDIVLVKDKERWKLEKPAQADAETSKISDVLDKLSGLQARDADIIDKADPKTYGFDDPAKVGHVTVNVEEEKGEGDKKTKTTRAFTFSLGKQDEDKKKLYVTVAEGPSEKQERTWERVNAVEDSLVALVKRPALAYRGRRVLDLAAADLKTIQLQNGKETVTLEQGKDGWKLTAPVASAADSSKVSSLTGTLTGLEATEYVNDAPKPEDLKTYGLDKDTLQAKLTFTEASKKPVQTLLIGKARPDKPGEFYARLESGPSVFAVKKDVRETLDQNSLAYRPLELWHVESEDVKALRLQPAGQDEYRLERKDGGWAVAGPFEAKAVSSLVDPMVTELTGPRAERYETHAAKDLKSYGLDAPYLRVVLTTAKEPAKEWTLLVGKPTEKDPKQRYARLADSEAVCVVGDKLLAAADKKALDLLDRKLLMLDQKSIDRVQSTGAAPLALQRQGEDWQVVGSPAPAAFPADKYAIESLLQAWSDLEAVRFAAYGIKVDLAKFGLDKPGRTMTVTVQGPAVDGKKPAPNTHTVAQGQAVEGSPGEVYARLDNGPGVAVLSPSAAEQMKKTYLDFVNRTLVKGDVAAVTGFVRTQGKETLDIRKKDDGWQIVKPQEMRADDQTLDRLVEQLAALRASRVAAYPAKELKPFGLDEPAAVVTLDGPKPIRLTIGRAVDGATGADADHFVQAAGADVIGVLPGALARQLLGEPVRFRDRAIARFVDADRAVLERGPRRATFARVDGTWKLIEPLEGEAEQLDLEDFINGLAKLRADELVAEKPADLKPFGLEKPEVRWRFQTGTREVLDLLVGSREKGGTRCYAKLAKGDLVFLLDPQLTNRVLAEYRKRSVWPTPPDAAQVESVRYNYAHNPFTLEKADNTWRVAGRADLKVNQQAVSDALAALAGLKVERFVVDKGADLKLFGLEPPELSLEVQAPGGKKELQIGHVEGESKRYYARVPEKDRTDVFVISEADGAKIVRDLMGFAQKADKPAP